MMYYGFELSWHSSLCKDGWYVQLDQYNHIHCVGLLKYKSKYNFYHLHGTDAKFFNN
jgi:hypothetical protein